MTREWTVWCVPMRVIDGDTFVADIDLGWGIWHTDVRIRVRDLWCPERNMPGGLDAMAFAGSLLGILVFEPLRLTSHALDNFGRTLASVTLPDGSDFASRMIDAGHGTKERT